MTLMQIKALIDSAIALVREEIAAKAEISSFGVYEDSSLSAEFRSRLIDEILSVRDEEHVTKYRTSSDYDVCTGKGYFVVEFTFNDGVSGNHEVRYCVEDPYYPESR